MKQIHIICFEACSTIAWPLQSIQRKKCNLKETASELCLPLCCPRAPARFLCPFQILKLCHKQIPALPSAFAEAANLTIQQTGRFSFLRVYSFWQLLIYFLKIEQNMKWWPKKQVSYLRHKPDLS